MGQPSEAVCEMGRVCPSRWQRWLWAHKLSACHPQGRDPCRRESWAPFFPGLSLSCLYIYNMGARGGRVGTSHQLIHAYRWRN